MFHSSYFLQPVSLTAINQPAVRQDTTCWRRLC